jgi:Tol biopolymer transport system component
MNRLLALACATMIIALAAGSVPLAAQDAAPPPRAKILFVDTSEQGKTYLAIMNADGSGKTRLTPAHNNIVFPRVCEKTGWIAFTNKLPDMTSEIYVLSEDRKKIKKFLTGYAFECFSPDGKFLLYTTCDQKAELFSYSMNSKRATKLSQDLKVTAADWSPNGEWIAVSAMGDDGTQDLYLISTLAQGVVRLTETKGINESFPVFTPDGKFLACITDRSGRSEIEYLDLTTKQFQRPLITGLYPAISPDGRWVAYQTGDRIGLSRGDGLDQQLLLTGRTPTWISRF